VDEFDESEEDLFDIPDTPTASTSSSSSSSSSTLKPPSNPRYQLERKALISQIRTAVNLPTRQRKTATKPLKTRNLREIIARYHAKTEGDDLGEMKGVLRSWRVLGLELTRRAGEEVLAKCMSAGRVDLAVELLNDPVQCGSVVCSLIFCGFNRDCADLGTDGLVEVGNAGLMKLHVRILSYAAYAEANTPKPKTSGETSTETTETSTTTPAILLPRLPLQPISPSIALANLVITAKVRQTADPQAIVQTMDISSCLDQEGLETWTKRRATWITQLESVGEAWGSAGRDIDSRVGLLVGNRVVKTAEQKEAENEQRRADRRAAKGIQDKVKSTHETGVTA
jgi:hypothetical protein